MPFATGSWYAPVSSGAAREQVASQRPRRAAVGTFAFTMVLAVSKSCAFLPVEGNCRPGAVIRGSRH